MLTLTNPRLRRFDIVINSFNSGVSNTPKEFSRAPEMSISKIISEPGMFLHQHSRRKSLKQLKGFANAHSCRKLSKQVDVINSDVQLVNFTALSVSNLPQEEFTIHSQPIKLKGISCIFNFPHEVEGILSEAMLPRFQIHFLSPQTFIRNKVLTMSDLFSSRGLVSSPSSTKNSQELNLMEDGDSSQNLKVWVSSPWM